MKTVIRAPLLTQSGYGIHSRQVYEWLEQLPNIELYAEVLNWGMTSWILDGSRQNGLISRIMSRGVNPQDKDFDLSVQVQLPDEWDSSLAKKNIGVSAFVETDRCSEKWIENCNKMDAIIVPSNFTKQVAKRSGEITTPVYVVPEWFNSDINGKTEALSLKLNPKFNFLTIGTITGQNAHNDRKNIFNCIKWFCETFKDDKKVGLVVKTSYGKATEIDKEMTKTIIRKVISEVRPGKFPKITLLHGEMTSKEVAGLYKHPKIKCYLAPTKGEGYGLPIVEAAASGMPIIATGWSGHTHFLQKGKYLDVNYNLVDIDKSRVDGRIFMEGMRWAHVDENDFKRKMIMVKDNHQKYKKLANDQKKHVAKNFSRESTIKLYNEVLKKII
jgi:glycosyltransferase involved in cell wall biosynthesis